MKIISGILPASSGEMFIDGDILNGFSDKIGFIFQEASLFDWLNVYDNVSYGLKIRKINRKDIERLTKKYLKDIGLEEYSKYYPSQLSGGMKQRVSMARTLILEPEIILMDEPFSALDYQTKNEMHRLTMDLWQKYKPSIIFVTHDIEEAIFLADRVIVMGRDGNISDEISVEFEKPRDKGILKNTDFMKIKAHLIDILL